jgi:hypothetical protein
MGMPGFTAEVGSLPAQGHYRGAWVAGPRTAGKLVAELVAPPNGGSWPLCSTSPCVTVGNCRTGVRCCRVFGTCFCTTVPCPTT